MLLSNSLFLVLLSSLLTNGPCVQAAPTTTIIELRQSSSDMSTTPSNQALVTVSTINCGIATQQCQTWTCPNLATDGHTSVPSAGSATDTLVYQLCEDYCGCETKQTATSVPAALDGQVQSTTTDQSQTQVINQFMTYLNCTTVDLQNSNAVVDTNCPSSTSNNTNTEPPPPPENGVGGTAVPPSNGTATGPLPAAGTGPAGVAPPSSAGTPGAVAPPAMPPAAPATAAAQALTQRSATSRGRRRIIV